MAQRSGSHRGFPSRRSPRRQTGWGLGPGNVTPTVITASTQAVVGDGVIANLDGLTIVRLRGVFTAYLSLATAIDDGFSGAIGIGMASQNAFADIGITALMHPLDDLDWDGWMYHQFIQIKAPDSFGAGADPIGQLAMAQVRIDVDSKAMRKFDEDSALFFAIDVDEVGGSAMQVEFNSRLLVKLP